MKGVVVDVNTIISALFWDALPLKAYNVASSQFIHLTSEDIIAELRNVLDRPNFASALSKKNITVPRIIEQYLDMPKS